MPWMPEVFTTRMAAARRVQDEETASTNDAVPYYEGILADEPDALVRSFAAHQPVLDDPRVGYVEGTRELRAFASGTADWLRERDAVVENVALTRTPTRTVEEVVLNLLADGGRVELPVAVVSDRNPDRTLKVIRVYHSTWPLTGEHRVRPPLLPADPNLHVEGTAGAYQRALAEGDLEGILASFEPDGYAREPSGAAYLHRGIEALRDLYAHMFADSGCIGLEHCTLTDDGVRCAIEYNGVRWGNTEIPPQAGVAVYERGGSGLLAAARIYDDVEPPAVSDTSLS
jgi:SnoaL-like domain